MILDRLQRDPEILGSVAEREELGERGIESVRSEVLATVESVVTQRTQMFEKYRARFQGGVGIRRDHKDLARGVAEHTIEVECQDMHER
jgi:23S rRNA maturation-related 3'-5' exoribonuclease YhaM